MDTFWIGETVVTRKGKRGVVVALAGGMVSVRFGSRVFDMRPGQLVSDRAYSKMTAPLQRQMYQ